MRGLRRSVTNRLRRLLLLRRSPPMRRWTPEELAHEMAALAIYIGLPEDQVPRDVWMRLVDYTVQRYLPADDPRTEAEWQATRRRMQGRLERAMRGEAVESLVIEPRKASPDPVFDAFVADLANRRRRRGRQGG